MKLYSLKEENRRFRIHKPDGSPYYLYDVFEDLEQAENALARCNQPVLEERINELERQLKKAYGEAQS